MVIYYSNLLALQVEHSGGKKVDIMDEDGSILRKIIFFRILK